MISPICSKATYLLTDIILQISKQQRIVKFIQIRFQQCINREKLEIQQKAQSVVGNCIFIQYQIMQAIRTFLVQTTPTVYYGVAALGAIYVFYHIFIILRGFLRLFFRRKQDFIKIYGEKSWVLVTGSSEGIGKQFALQFAAEGFNIILLARTKSKLQSAKQEILKLYPNVEVQIVCADLAQTGKKENIDEILPELHRFKNISIVINNAATEMFSNFTSIPTEKVINLININCFALAAVCYKFIPYFQNRMKESGKKCGFINVGSFAGDIPLPLLNVYSASKSYVDQLTHNLSIENPEINWLLLKPLEVSTSMTYNKKDIITISTAQCVAGTLRDFGHELQTNGALSHRIQSYLIRVLPRWIFLLVWYYIIGPLTIKYREEVKKAQ